MKYFIIAVLTCIGAFSFFQYYKIHHSMPKPTAMITQLPKPKPTKPAYVFQETAPLYGNARTYTYLFTGLATYEGKACPGALVEILTFSQFGYQVRRVTTGPDGHYTAALPVIGEPDETLSWEIHAETPTFQKADLDGRQILLSEPTVEMDESFSLADS
jgi:hypothetical protein